MLRSKLNFKLDWQRLERAGRAAEQAAGQAEKGQSLVEMAISFMVFVFLISGLIDFGRLYFTYVALEDRRREVRRHFEDMGATGDEEIYVFASRAPDDALRKLAKQIERIRPIRSSDGGSGLMGAGASCVIRGTSRCSRRKDRRGPPPGGAPGSREPSSRRDRGSRG